MAVVRARNSGGGAAVVGFALFVVSLVGAIIFYILWAGASNEATLMKSSLDRLGNARDQTDFSNSNPPSDTAKGQSLLRQAKDDMDRVRKDLNNAILERDSLKEQVASLKKSAEDFQHAASESDAAKQGASQDLKTAREGFATQVASLNDQITKLNDAIAAANRERDASVAKGQEDLNKAQQDWENKSRDMVLQLQQDKTEIERHDAENVELRKRLGLLSGGGNTTNVGDPDSTVVRVNQATGEAYILLGKNDRVVPGMTFTAYDPRLGVRYGTDEQAAGNGSMEVLEVGDTMSLCRITHITTGKTIQAGDLISNPVYHSDRTRQFHFVIRGDFDLDGDRISTAAERDRIVRLIRSWGGVVDESVSPQTDYIVMGTRPTNIATIQEVGAETAPSTPEPGSIADQRKKEQDSYDDVIVQGKRLAIPILNSNRFLTMIGYYNTTIVRYDKNAGR